MSSAVTCATCRLRLLIRSQGLSRQRRQWLSQTASQHHAPAEVDSLFAKFEEAIKKPRTVPRPTQGRVPRQYEQQAVGRYSGRGNRGGAPYRQEEAPIGRYSRRPIRSDEALEHEADPDEEHHSDGHRLALNLFPPDQQHYAKGKIRRPTFIGPALYPDLPPDEFEAVGKILSHETLSFANKFAGAYQRNQDDKAWLHLQSIFKYYKNPKELTLLGSQRFGRIYFYWVMREADAFIAGLRDQANGLEVNQDIPSPSVLLNFRNTMTTKVTTLWSHISWQLSSCIAEMQSTVGEHDTHTLAAIERATTELLSIFSLSIAAQRLHQSETTASPHGVDLLRPPPSDFSTLPEPSIFQEFLQQRESPYELYELKDTIRLLFPYVTDKGGRGHSSALVMLRVLQTEKLRFGAAHPKLKTLLEEALRSSRTRTVPSEIYQQMQRGSENAGKFYEQLVESFGLTPVHSTSVDHTATTTKEFHGTETASDAEVDDGEFGKAGDSSNPSYYPVFESLDKPSALTEESSALDQFVEARIMALGRALEQRKKTYADRELEIVREYGRSNPEVQLPRTLYEHIMTAYFGLREPGSALGIWQETIEAGHQPTVKTYTIVMRGSQYIHDYDMLLAFWAGLRNAGMQPDSHAWSVRISSMFRRASSNDAMQALNEMAQEWITAAKSAYVRTTSKGAKKFTKKPQLVAPADLITMYPDDVDGVPRPNLIVLNSAIAGAARDSLIPKILTWGRAFGIQPNLITYNYLLNISMRNGRQNEAFAILKRMDSEGVHGDSKTWTVLIVAMFEGGYLDGLDDAAQQARMMDFIHGLERTNAAPITNKGYATIIDRLLKLYRNIPAAEAVLAHMRASNVKPNAHIFSIIMASHFSTSPPNFSAIEALWTSIRGANNAWGAVLDSQFYDRMIEGYATHHLAVGSTRPMLHFLQQMQNEGKRPSWTALTYAARALAERGEWQRLHGIAATAKRNVEMSVSARQSFGQMEFWRFVQGTGVIGSEGVPVPPRRGVARGSTRLGPVVM